MTPTILLTGCAGFIGGNFLKKICTREDVKSKYNFVIIDALTYAGRYQTIQSDIENNENLSFEKIDIRDAEAINKIFEKINPAGIIHFAAESHVDRSIESPNIFVETNVGGTLNLLNAALKQKEKNGHFRFVHVSTDEVYGALSEQDPAFTENTPLAPNSPYSASKASSDLLVRSYVETFGLDAVTTRCSNNYGPFQFPEKLIPLMILNATQNKSLPVYGKGQNIRDWIHVDDHNRGVWAAFTFGKKGDVYNFGGRSERRNLDVVKTILKIMNKPDSLIEFVTDRKGHDWRYAIDFSKAQKTLNWSPEISFEQGLEQTVKWYRDNGAWLDMVASTR